MVGKDGKTYVYLIFEDGPDGDEYLTGVHDTEDGAIEHIKNIGYEYKTVGVGGFNGPNYYKHVRDWSGLGVWYRANIYKKEVRP